jgi:4-amino-4-deoxy-L-arabinose transferase-like glycosyltransferase
MTNSQSAVPTPGLDGWLQRHSRWIVLATIAIGAVLRLRLALPTYLNPDEALHFLLVNQPSVGAAYRASLTNAHPPLFFLILYFWRFLGSSEFALRLVSLLAGTAALGLAYRWLSRAFDPATGLAGLVLLTFAPEMIYLAAQVRPYANLLLFLFAALYFLERVIQEQSSGAMIGFGIMLALALLTHYSAALLAAALNLYVVALLLASRLNRRVAVSWISGQLVALALLGFLYVTHLSKLKNSEVARDAVQGWLSGSYFQPGHDRLLPFVARGAGRLFQYLATIPTGGWVLILAFLAGVGLLLIRRPTPETGNRRRRDHALLLLLPMAVAVAGALAGVYPYGGTRHDLFLIPFAVAGVSYLLARVTAGRLWPVLLAAAIVVPIWQIKSRPPQQNLDLPEQRRELMTAAVNYLRQSAPPGGFIFTSYQASILLGYYLGRNQVTTRFMPGPGELVEFPYGGYRVVASYLWSFPSPECFDGELERFVAAYDLRPGDRVWALDAGWGVNIGKGDTTFGKYITAYGLDARTRISPSHLDYRLASLIPVIARPGGPNVRTVLWPTDGLNDSVRTVGSRLANSVISYQELYQQADSAQDLIRYLPALAFWDFRTREKHPELFCFMGRGRNFISAGYRFALLATDPDTTVGVYLIEPAGPAD